MDEKETNDQIVIERSTGQVTIRIKADLGESLGKEYLRILHQFDVIEIIERTRQFWTVSDSQPKITGIASEGNRIVLSLLLSYPYFKTQQDIIADTDLHSGSVSRILTGKRGDFAKFIVKHGESYGLNIQGLRWIKEKLLPELKKLNQ